MVNIKRNLKKICYGIVVLSIFSVLPINASAYDLSTQTGWKYQNDAWYYYNTGFRQTGWLKDNDKWYFLFSNGKMATSWTKIEGNMYYFYSDGSMAKDTTIDGKSIDKNGISE